MLLGSHLCNQMLSSFGRATRNRAAFWNKETTRTQVQFCWLADQMGPILLLSLTPLSESTEALTWVPQSPRKEIQEGGGKTLLEECSLEESPKAGACKVRCQILQPVLARTLFSSCLKVPERSCSVFPVTSSKQRQRGKKSEEGRHLNAENRERIAFPTHASTSVARLQNHKGRGGVAGDDAGSTWSLLGS